MTDPDMSDPTAPGQPSGSAQTRCYVTTPAGFTPPRPRLLPSGRARICIHSGKRTATVLAIHCSGRSHPGWNLDDPDLCEVSYEALMAPEKRAKYVEILTHLGFREAEPKLATDLMHLFEAESRSGKASGAISQKSHVRSGKSGYS